MPTLAEEEDKINLFTLLSQHNSKNIWGKLL